MTLGWPRFEVAEFERSDSVPTEIQDAFRKARVPKSFFGERYVASKDLTPVEVGTLGRLIRFGHTGLSGGIYLDPTSGEVIEVLDPVEFPGAEPQPVNSTLGQFSNTVKTVIDMFPYYERDTSLEERMAIAKKIGRVIRGIDSPAITPDSFWETFLDDLVSGDFATQDIVGAAAN